MLLLLLFLLSSILCKLFMCHFLDWTENPPVDSQPASRQSISDITALFKKLVIQSLHSPFSILTIQNHDLHHYLQCHVLRNQLLATRNASLSEYFTYMGRATTMRLRLLYVYTRIVDEVWQIYHNDTLMKSIPV